MLARHPEASFPSCLKEDAELEAFYRLLRNDSLSFETVSAGHVAATVERCRELETVAVVHDWTEFAWGRRDGYLKEHLAPLSSRRQGFYAHYSIAVSADGLRAPLGTVGMKGYVHQRQVDRKTKKFWAEQFGACEVESEHWVEGIERAAERLDGCSVIHICDREADNNEVLRWLDEHEGRFVLRSKHPRKTADGRTLREVLDEVRFATKRHVSLSKRSLQGVPTHSRTHPARTARKAIVHARGVSVEIALPDGTLIPMQVVEVVERRPPKGQEPVRWILLTSEPVDDAEQLLHVIDLYRSRWLIEEFFKAIKTGCAYRKRQLDSASTLLIALALANGIAWRLLALRHFDRLAGELPASAVLNDVQLALLQHKVPKVAWSPEPTVHEVVEALMRLNSYRPSHGPPGWQVLGRGLETLLSWEAGARMGARIGLVINH